ncbi:MAG TPA: glycosyltransferase family 9 protein [Candidatus Limnocylindrales bacterium]
MPRAAARGDRRGHRPERRRGSAGRRPDRRPPPRRLGSAAALARGPLRAVARALAADGWRLAVTGTPAEAHLAEAIRDSAEAPVLDLVGRLDLSALVGLLARAGVVVANDTGPLHLASAVGSRTIGIYWVGNAINAAPPFRARDRPLLSWRLECPVCGVNCMTGHCEHDASFVDGVSVDEVLEAVAALAPQPASTAVAPVG